MKLSAPPPPPPPPSDGNPGAGSAGPPDEQPNPAPPAADALAAPPPAPAAKPAAWPAWYGGVDAALAGLVVVLAFAAASFVARNSDVWVHLAAGKRLFAGEYFPGGSDPFSYAAEGRTWVNHSWLTDAFAYLLYGGSGQVLVATKAVLAGLTFALLLAIRRPNFALWPWAATACVGVLACAPQFVLRPLVVSMLLFAVLLFLLFRVPHRKRSWRFPVAVGITFWVWASSDQWFFVGPLALALLLVGDLIQKYGFNSPDEPAETPPDEPLGRLPDTAALAKALGVGLLACTLTPHHVRVWELPFELTGAPGVMDDVRLRAQLLAPHDQAYVNSPTLGSNLNGLAYAVLFTGGAVVFGLGSARVRVAHVALWVGLAALSLLSVYAIPFFALAAVPLVAAQLNAMSGGAALKTWGDPRTRVLVLGSSIGRLVSVLAVCALVVLAYPGWVHPDASSPVYARRVAWGVEPDPAMARAAEQFQAWRAAGALPADARGFVAHTDLANYVAWYAPAEKVFVNGRLGHHRRDLAEFVAVRRGLGLIRVPNEEPNPADAEAVLAARGVGYVAVHGGPTDNDVLRMLARFATQQLLQRWDRWSAWYADGRTAVFGWHPAGGSPGPAFAGLRLDPAAKAFGPEVRRAADPEVQQPRPPLGWEAAFVLAPKPTPAGASEAIGWLEYKGAMTARQNVRRTLSQLFFHTLPAAKDTLHPLAVFAADVNRLLVFPPRGGSPEAAAALQVEADAARAAPLLAVRAARRAIAEDPDHPDGYYALGLALNDADLPLTEGERAVGMATAFRQCLQRMPRPDRYKRGQFLATGTDAALELARVYLGKDFAWRDARGREVVDFTGFPIGGAAPFHGLFGQPLFREKNGVVSRGRPVGPDAAPLFNGAPFVLPIDLARQALQTALEYAPEDLKGEPDDRLKAKVKQVEDFRKVVEDVVIRYKDRYEAGRGLSPKLPALVGLAIQNCMLGEALKLLTDKAADLDKEYGPNVIDAVVTRVGLELATGHLEDAADDLKYLSSPEVAAALERNRAVGVVQALKYQKAVLAGEYKQAGELWEGLNASVGQSAGLPPPGPLLPLRYVLGALQAVSGGRDPAKVLPGMLAPPLVPAPAHAQALAAYFWLVPWVNTTGALQQAVHDQLVNEANFFFRRGVLFLLEGDVAAAKDRFRDALRSPPPGWDVSKVQSADADFYLKLIERAEARAAAPK